MTTYGFIVVAWLMWPFADTIIVPFGSMEACEKAKATLQYKKRHLSKFIVCVKA